MKKIHDFLKVSKGKFIKRCLSTFLVFICVFSLVPKIEFEVGATFYLEADETDLSFEDVYKDGTLYLPSVDFLPDSALYMVYSYGNQIILCEYYENPKISYPFYKIGGNYDFQLGGAINKSYKLYVLNCDFSWELYRNSSGNIRIEVNNLSFFYFSNSDGLNLGYIGQYLFFCPIEFGKSPLVEHLFPDVAFTDDDVFLVKPRLSFITYNSGFNATDLYIITGDHPDLRVGQQSYLTKDGDYYYGESIFRFNDYGYIYHFKLNKTENKWDFIEKADSNYNHGEFEFRLGIGPSKPVHNGDCQCGTLAYVSNSIFKDSRFNALIKHLNDGWSSKVEFFDPLPPWEPPPTETTITTETTTTITSSTITSSIVTTTVIPPTENDNSKGFANVAEAIKGIPGAIVNGLGNFFDGIGNAITGLGTALINGLKTLFIPRESFIQDFFGNMKSNFDLKIPIVSQLTSFMSDFISAVGSSGSEVPSFKMNIYGAEAEVIDFTLYTKYRPYIHGLTLGFAWVMFGLRVLKKLPNIISGG